MPGRSVCSRCCWPAPGGRAAARHWLLVGEGPLAEALCAAWQARGDRCTLVPDHAAASAEACAPASRRSSTRGGRRLRGVVHAAAALAAGARTAQEQYTAAAEGAVAVDGAWCRR